MAFVANKIKHLPPYLFAELQSRKKQLVSEGIDVIDLGIGAPDLPTPNFVIDQLIEAVKYPVNHRYAPYSGIREFKEAVAAFYHRRYGVELDPETEVLALIGSKEGIAHLIQTVINPGDTVMVPDPGYPVYQKAVHLAGGETFYLPLDADKGYAPFLDHISDAAFEKAKLLLLNYPANPTAATVDLSVFMKAIALAEEKDLLIVHDAAYDLVTFDDYKAPSVLQVPGAKSRAIEMGSLSKSFCMTGWRIGYAVGNKEVIQALTTMKSNIDSGQFIPIQKAAAAALKSDLSTVRANNQVFQKRMDVVYRGLKKMGIHADRPRGTIFIWARVPDGFDSVSFADRLLKEAGVIITPGSAFGPSGEGYFRMALTVSLERLIEATERMSTLVWKERQTNA